MVDMLTDLGHEVILYASEDNESRASEHVVCISKREQKLLCNVTGPENVLNAGWSPEDAHWKRYTENINIEMRTRIQPDDIVLLSNGWPFSAVIEQYSGHVLCEYAVGYMGWHDKTARVLPSQAWLHAMYGKWYGVWPRGRFSDRVIPHYFDPKDFPVGDGPRNYLLFVGRLNEDKGVQIAIDTAKALGAPLVVAGAGEYPLPDWVDHRGLVGIEERGILMAGAAALFAPSLYLEPFGKVAVEAQLCGTPAITTDWGGFPETVEQGVTGWRCNSPREFIDAAKKAMDGILEPAAIQAKAEAKFSMDVIGPRYISYFQELLDRHHTKA